MSELTTELAAAEAARLDQAEQQRTQVSQTTLNHDNLTLDDAYRIQAQWQKLRLDRGETMVGHKIGLTSRAMQAAMNIDTPDSGFLTDAMTFEGGAELEANRFSCLLYTSPSPRDATLSRMPSSA